MKRTLLLGWAAVSLSAQTVQVYSEFAQLNDAGEVLAPENPREILSPAVPRNAFSSFQLAIQVPRGVKFLIYIGQNPDNAAKVTLYRRESGKLVPIVVPYEGVSSQVLWMDLWMDGNAPVRRRSLYIITGEARSEWQHSIAPVKETRYSVTLRTLRDKLTG